MSDDKKIKTLYEKYYLDGLVLFYKWDYIEPPSICKDCIDRLAREGFCFDLESCEKCKVISVINDQNHRSHDSSMNEAINLALKFPEEFPKNPTLRFQSSNNIETPIKPMTFTKNKTFT